MLRRRAVRVPVALLLVLLLAVLQLSACSQWTLSTRPLAELVKPRPDRLKILLVSGQEIILYEPTIVGDSVIGGLSRNWRPAGGAWTHEVVSTSTRKASDVRTAIVVVAVTAAIAVTLQGLKQALQDDYDALARTP